MYIETNTILITKDAHKIGNAIVLSKDSKFIYIKTDYGNDMKFTQKEIESLFELRFYFNEDEKYFCEQNHKYSVKVM